MTKLFISHSSANNFEAVALRDWLVSEGWNDLFLDLDPESGIAAGERWQRALFEAASRCEAVLFLISKEWLASRWCLNELSLARRLNKRLFGISIEDVPLADMPAGLSGEWQLVDLSGGQDHRVFKVALPNRQDGTVTFSESGLRSLRNGLSKAGIDVRFFNWPPANEPDRAPYRGFEPLDIVDAGIFFGREAPILEALDTLRGLTEPSRPRIVTILGASGAGKSSFLRAGLVPRLMRDDRNFATLCIVRPERAVLSGPNGFVAALDEAAHRTGMPSTRASIRAAVAEGGETLRQLLQDLVLRLHARSAEGDRTAGKPAIILAVDQAEELFSGQGEPEASTFLRLIRDLALLDSPTVIVIFAIRSDTYDALERAKPLEDLRQIAIPLLPLPRGAYQTIIEGPAQRLQAAGKKFEIDAALTQQLLLDIEKGGGSDTLPLIAFTLEQLYRDYGRRGRLTLADYEEFGGLKGAIEQALAQVFAAADADTRIPKDNAARLTLLRRGLIPWLAGIDPETKSPRRRIARLSEIPEEAQPLIALLVEQRLLLTDAVRESDETAGISKNETTIEPAHEALLRQWGQLHGWLEEDFGTLASLEGVKRAAREWAANGRSADWLAHGGARLVEASAIDRRADLAQLFDATDRSYLADCFVKDSAATAAAVAQQEAEAALAQEQQAMLMERTRSAEALAASRRRIAQRTSIGLAMALGLAAAAAVFFVRADRARKLADANAYRAEAAKQDFADFARYARYQNLMYNQQVQTGFSNLADWSPQSYHVSIAFNLSLNATRKELFRQSEELSTKAIDEAEDPYLLVNRSYNRVLLGNADGAFEDAIKAKAYLPRSAIVYVDLAVSQAMRGNYDSAVEYMDAAFNDAESNFIGETVLDAETAKILGGRTLIIRDSDFRVALRYVKAGVFAATGNTGFSAQLSAADLADRDYPFSRNGYFLALDWLRFIKSTRGGDYGISAAEAAIWERIAMTRPDFAVRASEAYKTFEDAYRVAPRAAYAKLAEWVHTRHGEPIATIIEERSDLDNVLNIEIAAGELIARGILNRTDNTAAASLLSEAISVLNRKPRGQLGRQETDLLIDLLITRANLFANAAAFDDALKDAQTVLEFDPKAAGAYAVIGASTGNPQASEAALRRAIDLKPDDIISGLRLANLLKGGSKTDALDVLKRTAQYSALFPLAQKSIDMLEAEIDTDIGRHNDAARAIAKAVDLEPWDLKALTQRQAIDIALKDGKEYTLHFWEGVRSVEAYVSRQGGGNALGEMITGFHDATSSDRTPQEIVDKWIGDFDALLIRHLGKLKAAQWWQYYAYRLDATQRERKAAIDAFTRTSANR